MRAISLAVAAAALLLALCSAPVSSKQALVAKGEGDPRLQGFNGHKYTFCFHTTEPECQGRVFNLISSELYHFNTELKRMPGENAFPFSASWMTGFGLLYGPHFTAQLRLRTDIDYTLYIDPSYANKTRGSHPDGAHGSFRSLIASFRINGEDKMGYIESLETLDYGPVTVHFPTSHHASDPTDGPVAIITTPEMTVSWYIESEDIWHLDFSIELDYYHGIQKMHGALGQSLYWPADGKAEVEDGDLAYAVEDGILGTDCDFNRFGIPPKEIKAKSKSRY